MAVFFYLVGISGNIPTGTATLIGERVYILYFKFPYIFNISDIIKLSISK